MHNDLVATQTFSWSAICFRVLLSIAEWYALAAIAWLATSKLAAAWRNRKKVTATQTDAGDMVTSANQNHFFDTSYAD